MVGIQLNGLAYPQWLELTRGTRGAYGIPSHRDHTLQSVGKWLRPCSWMDSEVHLLVD